MNFFLTSCNEIIPTLSIDCCGTIGIIFSFSCTLVKRMIELYHFLLWREAEDSAEGPSPLSRVIMIPFLDSQQPKVKPIPHISPSWFFGLFLIFFF